MAQIIWTEPAISDLDEITEYIALDKPEAAGNLVKRVFEAIERLKNFPDSGKKPPEFSRKTRYREVIIGPCRIFYRVEKNRVFILYVMRSERVLRQYILSDRT